MTGYSGLLHSKCAWSIETTSGICKRTQLGDKLQKSELTPTKQFDSLTYTFDLSKGKASPTEKNGVP